MAQFQIGETVQLKSGGPVMTVSSAPDGSGNVECQWFVGDMRMDERFMPDTLKPAKED